MGDLVRSASKERFHTLLQGLAGEAPAASPPGSDAGLSGTGAECQLPTDLDRALDRYDAECEAILATLVQHAKRPGEAAFFEETCAYGRLDGVCFVGHVNTDMDSIGGAMGAAELFGGTACRSEETLNGEILYVLEHVAKTEPPPLYATTPGCGLPAADGNLLPVCLVDHNEPKQMCKLLQENPQRIVGLIDHHALSAGFSSNVPLVMDVRPWGSMASIIAHLFVRLARPMTEVTARLLLCAILSDTLNLRSVTTTAADRFAVALLAKRGRLENRRAINDVAKAMFRAKTKWVVGLGPYAMVRGDQKDFEVDGWKFGIAVLEVTDPLPVLEVADDLLLELRLLKKEKGAGRVEDQLDFAFLFVVDITAQRSHLLVCGGREHALARAAFPGAAFREAMPGIRAPGTTIAADCTLCEVGGLVSRKAQFVPAFSAVLAAGFECHRTRVTDPAYRQGQGGAALDKVLSSGGAAVRVQTGSFFEGKVRGQGLERASQASLALYDPGSFEKEVGPGGCAGRALQGTDAAETQRKWAALERDGALGDGLPSTN